MTDALKSLPANDVIEHKKFLESHVHDFYQAINISTLMNPNWNYLFYPPLDHLMTEFYLDEVKGKPTRKICKTNTINSVLPNREEETTKARFWISMAR